MRLLRVIAASVLLCLLLIIFIVLKKASHGVDDDVMFILILTLVTSFQVALFFITVPAHAFNNSIYDVLVIHLLTCAVTFIEVNLVSSKAANFTLIGWGVIIILLLMAHSPIIYYEDIVFSQGIRKLLAIIWILIIVFIVKSIV